MKYKLSIYIFSFFFLKKIFLLLKYLRLESNVFRMTHGNIASDSKEVHDLKDDNACQDKYFLHGKPDSQSTSLVQNILWFTSNTNLFLIKTGF